MHILLLTLHASVDRWSSGAPTGPVLVTARDPVHVSTWDLCRTPRDLTGPQRDPKRLSAWDPGGTPSTCQLGTLRDSDGTPSTRGLGTPTMSPPWSPRDPSTWLHGTPS